MDFRICIIGAGAVGLAIAKSLSERTEGIVVVEKNLRFGEETSSRNSEVIHSGIYYPAGSLKARLCKNGNQMLYEYCREKQIPHRKCGKLIVATHREQLSRLKELHVQGVANGVEGIRTLKEDEIRNIEPDIFAETALFIPATGILDSHALMKNLFADAVSNGGDFVFKTEVTQIEKLDKGYRIEILESNGNKYTFTSGMVINCAGLGAEKLARSAGIAKDAYRLHYCKGEYFRLTGVNQVKLKHLVYPVPEPGLAGLGVHATISMDDSIKLGPNVLYLKENIYDYTVNPEHKKKFFESARKFLPFLEEQHLEAEMAGIRPKLQAEGDGFRDFVIQDEAGSGFPGFINLIGIESPGLTSCLSIASFVANILRSNIRNYIN